MKLSRLSLKQLAGDTARVGLSGETQQKLTEMLKKKKQSEQERTAHTEELESKKRL